MCYFIHRDKKIKLDVGDIVRWNKAAQIKYNDRYDGRRPCIFKDSLQHIVVILKVKDREIIYQTGMYYKFSFHKLYNRNQVANVYCYKSRRMALYMDDAYCPFLLGTILTIVLCNDE